MRTYHLLPFFKMAWAYGHYIYMKAYMKAYHWADLPYHIMSSLNFCQLELKFSQVLTTASYVLLPGFFLLLMLPRKQYVRNRSEKQNKN